MAQRIITLPDDSEIKQGGNPESSPHILNLDKPIKTANSRVTDVISIGEDRKQTQIIAKKQRQNLFQKSEVVRMGAIAVTMVLLLNLAQVGSNALTTKDETLNAAYAGVESLMDIDPNDMEQTGEAFQAALVQFEIAENTIWYLTDQDGEIMDSNKYLKTAKNLLDAGGSISSAGQYFALFVTDVKDVSQNLFADMEEGKPSITEALETAYNSYLVEAYAELMQAQEYLGEVDASTLPDDYEEKAVFLAEQITNLNSFLEKLSSNFPTILGLLGDAYPQKYMVLLENNSELRPGGGFIGSFLLVDLNDGYIENMEFHDVYEYDGQFNEYIEPPATEIAYLTCCWGLRDANYSPDYSVSSAATQWLFEKEGGPTVDHVVMVDLDFVSGLIDAIGSLYVESLGGELTGDNFELVISYIVESKLRGIDDPKSVLEDVIPLLKAEITKPENLFAVMGELLYAAQAKHVAAYSTNEEAQSLWQGMNIDGELYLPGGNEDYLLVTTSGIGGNKTDRYVYQDITHKTLISQDGSLLDKLTITREHTWDEEVSAWQIAELGSFGFEEISDTVRNILGSGTNVAGIRIYVPNGATIESSTQDIEMLYDEDLSLNYFYAVMSTEPGATSQLEITYSLPFSMTMDPVDDYFLYVETQPGTINTTFTKEIIAPNLNNNSLYPQEELTEQADLSYKMQTDLDHVIHLGGVFSK